LIVGDLVTSVKVLHGVEKCHCQRRSKYGILTFAFVCQNVKMLRGLTVLYRDNMRV